MQSIQLSIKTLPLASLKHYERNPREHTSRQIKQIARSIDAFGFVCPILIDANNEIVAGHGRAAAAKLLNFTEVPVVTLSHLNAAQITAFRIADNKLTENSSWNEEMLTATFRELENALPDLSLDVTCFSLPEIDLRLHAPEIFDEALEPEIAIPERNPISKLGDLWRLGRHSICCGDSRMREAYDMLLPSEKAAIVFTDPPYNVRIDGHATGNGSIKHAEFAMASGEMSDDQFVGFLSSVCKQLIAHSHDGSMHFLCMDWAHSAHILKATEFAYTELKNICVWVKNNGGMGSLYRSRHEFIFVFKNGKSKHQNNIELGRHGRNRTNVWEYSGSHQFVTRKNDEQLGSVHPTIKPVQLIADALLDCSKRKDIVLDAFLGSGSTLIAAERVGRSCRGIEINPFYVDVAIRRWQNHTGAEAVHLASGHTFNELSRDATRDR